MPVATVTVTEGSEEGSSDSGGQGTGSRVRLAVAEVQGRALGGGTQAVENQGSVVAANAGPTGTRLPEVEALNIGVTQGGGGANKGGYPGLSDD